MDKKAERIKSMIKGGVKSNPTFGTDPNDPWSAKAGISEDNITEDELLNRYMRTRGINPKTASKISKISASKTGDFEKWKQQHVSGGRLPVVKKEALDHGFPEIKDSLHSTHRRKAQWDKRKHYLNPIHQHGAGLRKEEHDEDSLSKKHGVSVDFIKKQLEKGQKVEHEHTKDDAKALKIAKDHVAEIPDYYDKLNKMEKGKCNEDTYQDPLAATQSVFDGANNPNDTMSKAARMIKNLHKKKVHEEIYDHEKEDKSVATYGKKPKHEKADKEDSIGEKKPQAAAVLTGGTTLTGQKRDDIELDPLMRVRPGQPDPTKDKDKKKDEKKQDNKKDK